MRVSSLRRATRIERDVSTLASMIIVAPGTTLRNSTSGFSNPAMEAISWDGKYIKEGCIAKLEFHSFEDRFAEMSERVVQGARFAIVVNLEPVTSCGQTLEQRWDNNITQISEQRYSNNDIRILKYSDQSRANVGHKVSILQNDWEKKTGVEDTCKDADRSIFSSVLRASTIDR
ncbi:uncharacterized protein LOC143154846 [Ptiloglossa arizonensis]|uniref:uncharacterized protein LOC143154846 n=1 Tax=Ptiloglossa arizonensis TaxID=3350558 RepID=UPI003FA0FD5B